MAALTEAQVELANSLTQDELPTKLRCAVCSKLAINAYRLPCCETAICETCQATLPSSCPVCEHSPVSGADCTVYKSLRTTIRVFLKTEEKKREASRPKPSDSAPATPVENAPPALAAQPATDDAAHGATAKQSQQTAISDDTGTAVPAPPSGEQVLGDPAQPADGRPQEVRGATLNDLSSCASNEISKGDATVARIDADGKPTDQDLAETTEFTPEGGDAVAGDDADEVTEAADDDQNGYQENGMGYSSGPSGGNFNGMNFAGADMNQMQMMMAMQNGMNPAAFGSFSMPGMDMNMNPMMMPNMFMNGGFGAQGMGMNGMNMNMGMNGFSGGGNDWNGQQSWNVGQDNFNPNAPGMGNGDFGNFNSGNYAGYGHHTQYNDYNRGGYGFRGRGRGRGRGFYGGYGRGYHNGYNNAPSSWAQQNGQYYNQGAQGNGFNAGQGAPGGSVDDNSQTTDQAGTTIQTEDGETTQTGREGAVNNTNGAGSSYGDASQAGAPEGMQADSGSGPLPSATVPDVPLNAPTGPKAMRQGLPNTSFHYLKARGLLPGDAGSNGSVVASPVDERHRSRSGSVHAYKDENRRDSEHGAHTYGSSDQRRPRGDDDDRHEEPRPYPASRSQSRDRSHERKESRRHRRHGSESASDGGDDDDGRDVDDEDRHRSHRSKRRSARDEDDSKGRSRDNAHDDRSRSASPDDRERDRDRDSHRDHDRERDHKRSSHRSRRDRDDRRRERDRDRDRDRDREKDRDRDGDDDRHRRSGHRSSRRDRDYDRGDRDKGRDDRRHERRDRDRDRDRDRERDRDRDSRRSSKVASSTPLTPIEGSEFNPPSGPKRHTSIFNIKGNATGSGGTLNHKRNSESASRSGGGTKGSGSSTQPAPSSSTAGKDIHTLEREARDRERLLKEAQRIAGMAGFAGSKRGRDDSDDRGSGSRRKSRRSEAVNADEEESRMRRLEAERERDRWD
ncbi:uncharacterized protein B0I36DRAFT_379917 [Microdochium trichocladiopsis]|uniref:RING-type domain-containing protein n=1 Tax=Microdochium trichocladiopsis TaxID=1682393 RepID=A0A9P8YLB1_9PEZI|nr:uncharacterized protein B0I36DRAFT_379917 [Microdochium trichocladiopsis]KAH7041094.1 hypothetical protein B0I36DRAFT_379917 [Microdochium trichocladiopsis]